MMTLNIPVNMNSVFAFVGCVIGVGGIGYALSKKTQAEEICQRFDKAVDEVSKNTTVDISDELIRKAVDSAVKRETRDAVTKAVNAIEVKISSEIEKQVRDEVKAQQDDLQVRVEEQIETLVSDIDISELKRQVRKDASDKVARKFDGELVDILDGYNSQLNNVKKIYSSIADAMQK